MNFQSKIFYYSNAVFVSFFLIMGVTPLAFADSCAQKRTTPHAPPSALKQTNPLGANTTNVLVGEKLFQKEAKPMPCAQCHGPKGKGDGLLAKGMSPPPRDFSCTQMMKDIPDGQLFWVIKNGSKGTGMMPFGNLSDDQIWQLVSYLRKLSQ